MKNESGCRRLDSSTEMDPEELVPEFQPQPFHMPSFEYYTFRVRGNQLSSDMV